MYIKEIKYYISEFIILSLRFVKNVVNPFETLHNIKNDHFVTVT